MDYENVRDYEDTRISKLRMYLFQVIDTITEDTKYQINANMLAENPNNYSLDKIPTQVESEPQWIIGVKINKDVYSFRSRMSYSQDTINNIKNVGFFEEFESIIESNNRNKILPEIDGIESIECLNSGSIVRAETNTAEFYIQLQITYRRGNNEENNSEDRL